MSEPADLSEPFNLAEDEHVSLQAVDPELDIKSEHFNPLKALLSTDVPIPIGDAPLYNNIAHYESTMKRQNTSALPAAPKVPSKSYRQEVELHQRRFLPHQEMVKGKGKTARQTRNIVTKMCSNDLAGPLSILQKWRTEKRRVKIHTRNVTTINGFTTGFIEAFDKHWNIVLTDVIEIWRRKKFHYCPKTILPSDHRDDKQFAECMRRLQRLNVTVPAVTAKSLNRKLVECTRIVPKLLIRGEQIATIILDSETMKPETEIKLNSSN